NVSEGMKLFKALAQNNKTIYNTLASLNIAAYEDYKKNYEMAIKHYTEVIEDKNASDLFKDFAKLMVLKSEISAAKTDKEKIITELKTYVDGDTAFKSSAL